MSETLKVLTPFDEITQRGTSVLLADGIPEPTLRLTEYPPERRAFGVIFPLPDDLNKAIVSNLLDPTRAFFEGTLGTEQVFARSENLHATGFLIFNTDTDPNFNPETDPVTEYARVVDGVLSGLTPVQLVVDRLVRYPGNPGGLLTGGMPADNGLQLARRRLAEDIEAAGLRQDRSRGSIDSPIVHITLMRDLTPVGVSRATDIIDFIAQRDREIWAGMLEDANLQDGNYFQDPETVRIHKRFHLSRQV